jgi:hypothetical protein
MTTTGEPTTSGDSMVGHMVYFKLKEPTPESRKRLVALCHELCKGHPGEVFFAVGEMCKDFNRDVNDHNWDVALHIIFRSKADHDYYQYQSERHQRFVATEKGLASRPRVFDSLIAAG